MSFMRTENASANQMENIIERTMIINDQCKTTITKGLSIFVHFSLERKVKKQYFQVNISNEVRNNCGEAEECNASHNKMIVPQKPRNSLK